VASFLAAKKIAAFLLCRDDHPPVLFGGPLLTTTIHVY
jgi:hypothetical protein